MASLDGIAVRSQGETTNTPLNGIIYRDQNGQLTNFNRKNHYAFVKNDKITSLEYTTSDISIDEKYLYTLDENGNLNKILISNGSTIWKVSINTSTSDPAVSVAKKGNDEILIVTYRSQDYYVKTFSSDGVTLGYSGSSGFSYACFGNRDSDCFYVIEANSSAGYGNNLFCVSTQTLKGTGSFDTNLLTNVYPSVKYLSSMNATVVIAGNPSKYVSLYKGDMLDGISMTGFSGPQPIASTYQTQNIYDSIAASNADKNMFYIYMRDGNYQNGSIIMMDSSCTMVNNWQLENFKIAVNYKFDCKKMFMIDDVLFMASADTLLSFRETKTVAGTFLQFLHATDLNLFTAYADRNHLNVFTENGQIKMIQNGIVLDYI